MPMTIVVTRSVAPRIRGFLASCMCEIAPGAYTSPRMSSAVRNRIWAVVEEWFVLTEDAYVVMTWPSPKRPGGQEVLSVGVPRKWLQDHHGVILAGRTATSEEVSSLTIEDECEIVGSGGEVMQPPAQADESVE